MQVYGVQAVLLQDEFLPVFAYPAAKESPATRKDDVISFRDYANASRQSCLVENLPMNWIRRPDCRVVGSSGTSHLQNR